MPKLCGMRLSRTIGELPICWVIDSITTGGIAGLLFEDMVGSSCQVWMGVEVRDLGMDEVSEQNIAVVAIGVMADPNGELESAESAREPTIAALRTKHNTSHLHHKSQAIQTCRTLCRVI